MGEPLDYTMLNLSPANFLLLLGILTVSCYSAYLKALPKPIPGIPYNEEATRSLLGDIKSMVKYASATKELYPWMTSHNLRHNSPITQVFGRPFSKPWVIVADYREAQDVCLRRTKEFDRSDFFGDIFLGLVPNHHISMRSTDAAFKQQKKWLQDLMTPSFLNAIAAPAIYTTFLDLLDVWEEKSRVAKGHPFRGSKDVYRAALDAAWSIVFGTDINKSATRASIRSLASIHALSLPSDIDAEVTIPEPEVPTSMSAVMELTGGLEKIVVSPVPRLAHWLLRKTPSYRKAAKIKDDLVGEEIAKTVKRFEGRDEKDMDIRCALDDMIRRETIAATKDERPPLFQSRAMADEVFGLVVGAHDTTSTALNWSLKFLADNQSVQAKLRSALRSAHPVAVAENRKPTAQEIAKTSIPYRDAVQEECLRCSLTEPSVVRKATVDTDILGCRIPKGTDVFFMGNGPSIFSPAFHIDDSLRSQGALAAKERIGSWDPEDMAMFNPERWLVEPSEGGEEKEFSAAAGPLLTFGLGPRGCYGRRMAYIEMRIFLTLVVWNFELQRCPEALSGYAAVDTVTHAPQQCFVRLRPMEP